MVNAFFARNFPATALGLLRKFDSVVTVRFSIPPGPRQRLRVLAQRLRRSRGASAVEYGLMVAFISIAILGGLSSLGITLRDDVLKIISEMQTYLG